MDSAGFGGIDSMREEQLRLMNEEINEVIRRRGDRGAAELVPGVEAVMRRYGVPEPATEGLIQWIDKAIASAETTGAG
ncbi:MAG: hypothetical protein AUI14_14385 [Actinobacteria bacterium 13_2_20CM_2_71_6]|nr:MAG: hypothetical protein AUI14_14385 [Actinobacteria bacterium 13_2_20CM_2_71_6]